MTRPTFTISVPGYVPVTVTLEPAAVIDGPAVPPPSADAPRPIVAAAADLDRRRAMAAARQKRRRDRLASRSPSVTERDTPRDSVTHRVTEEGGLGGDGSGVSSVERLGNKAETQETPDPKPSQSAPIAPVTRHARVTPSRSPVTHPDQPMTPTPRKDDPAAIKAACAAISDAWPRGTQGGGPQNLAAIDRLATTIAGAEWFPKPSTTLDGLRFILERVEAWKASPRFKACAAGGVKLPGWNTWIRTSLDEAQPLPWDDAPAVEFKSKAGLGTGKTAAETGVKTL